MNKKFLLFINGQHPKELPSLENYDFIACTDGAFHYLKEKKFPLDRLDFISGDLDSLKNTNNLCEDIKNKIIYTPDQNKTDFHKALEIILEKKIYNVDVFGGSGKEQDHFIGNLSTAYIYFNKINITFYDDYSKYFFIPKHFEITGVIEKTISLLPFPIAKDITTTGLKWSLNKEDLNLTQRIGTRNIASEDKVTCSYSEGALLIFINK